MKERNKMNTFLSILAAIVEPIANRTNEHGQENSYWNIGFRCATGRIFYAVLTSARESQKREDDLHAELTILAETDPDCQNVKTARVSDSYKNAMAVTTAMAAFRDAFDELHHTLTGDQWDEEQYKATWPENRKKVTKYDKKKLDALLKERKAA
jgi:hypothetical protein